MKGALFKGQVTSPVLLSAVKADRSHCIMTAARLECAATTSSVQEGVCFMATNAGGVAGDILRSFIERIERLEEEKKGIADDIRDVYAEAKSSGFEPKIMRQVVRLRKMESHEREEQEALLDIYLHALEGGRAPQAED